MTENTTVTQRLADALLAPKTLDEYVIEKREAVPKWPWRLIAKQLATDTGGQVAVSHTALRRWYADDLEAAS